MSESVNIKHSPKAWDTNTRVAKKSQGRSQCKKPRNNKGHTATTNAEKADIMAEHLSQKQMIAKAGRHDQQCINKVDEFINNKPELFTL